MDTKKLRQKILDLAICGKLVPQDPNEEPASVLLDRIRKEKEQLIAEGKIKRSRKAKNSSDTHHYENVPFEVPEGWIWTTLEEICLFLSRGKSPKYSNTEKTYPVFAQKCNLKEGGISLEQARFLDPSTIWKWSEEYKLKTGDVLVNSTGTGTVGRTRLFHERYLKNYPFVVPDSHVSVIRTTSEIKSEFVFAYISSQLVQQYLEDNLAGSTNQKELYIGVLSDLLFPIPPIAEQQRIVAEIERWFALIDTIEHSKEDLETAIEHTKRKILDLAIHGKLVPQDPNDEPASELLKRINPKAKITCDNGHSKKLPDAWCHCRISDVSLSLLGKTLDRSKNTGNMKKYLCAINVKWGIFDLATIKEMRIEDTELERYSVKNGDLMVCEGGDVGRAAIWTYNSEIYYQNALHRIRFKNNISARYFLYSLMYLKSIGIIDDVCKGVTIKHLTQNAMDSLIFNLPPLAEQHRIAKKIEELFSVLDNIQKALEV